jgi:tripartite-type tricarboxylate transporter receptor subunit TctC
VASGLATVGIGPSGIAWAEIYPARPVRLMVGYAAGGANDIVARLIGQWLSERFGQTFIVENRPGAASNIATEAVVNSPPDGHTLLLVNASNAINATLYEKLNYNFIRDIVPVASIMRVPNVMAVNPYSSATTISEFIAYGKANPAHINFVSGGIGTSDHMAGELFRMMTGLNMTHVPYRGEAPAMIDLLGGQVQLIFGTAPASVEHIRAGRLRLAVTTATRSDALPGIPTLGEFLPGYEASSWYGIGVPKNTPAEIVNKLNKEINTALTDAKMKTRLADLGGMMLPGTPTDFGKLVANETEKWAKVVRFAGNRSDPDISLGYLTNRDSPLIKAALLAISVPPSTR